MSRNVKSKKCRVEIIRTLVGEMEKGRVCCAFHMDRIGIPSGIVKCPERIPELELAKCKNLKANAVYRRLMPGV